jgi:GLPGLI family protein
LKFVRILRRKSFKIGLLFIVLSVFLWCCKHKGPGGKLVSEGVIEFEATAVDPNSPMADLAPNKMVVKFKNNRSVAEMSAGMGLLNMLIVADYNNKTVTQLIKLLNKKYVSIASAEEINKELTTSKMRIQKAQETKLIAGYKCKKAVISFDDNSHPPFDVFYTDEIELEKPNWSNEYNEIDGVLMEYQLKRYGLELRFTARRVAKANIEDSEFETPSDYKIISQKELEELFQGMQ